MMTESLHLTPRVCLDRSLVIEAANAFISWANLDIEAILVGSGGNDNGLCEVEETLVGKRGVLDCLGDCGGGGAGLLTE